jgi:hypothetical protein
MFLKEKRCGKMKGHGCADGRKQQEYLTKEETSSPTVAIESVMLSCTIDAQHEGRDGGYIGCIHADRYGRYSPHDARRENG